MSRVGIAIVAVTILLGTSAPVLARPASFAVWWSHFSARVQRDVVRINHVCQKRYGVDDAKVGACFVKHERVSLRRERAAWEKQVEKISRSQRAPCKRRDPPLPGGLAQIGRSRVSGTSTPIGTARLTQVSRDLNAQPFESLRVMTFEAKARAVRICG